MITQIIVTAATSQEALKSALATMATDQVNIGHLAATTHKGKGDHVLFCFPVQ